MVESAHKVLGNSQVAVVLFEIVIFFCRPFNNRKRDLGWRCLLGFLHLAHCLWDSHHGVLSQKLDDVVDSNTINEPIRVFAIMYARSLPTCYVVLRLIAQLVVKEREPISDD